MAGPGGSLGVGMDPGFGLEHLRHQVHGGVSFELGQPPAGLAERRDLPEDLAAGEGALDLWPQGEEVAVQGQSRKFTGLSIRGDWRQLAA